MSSLPRPCSAAEAVQRAQRLLTDPTLGNATHGYALGAGAYRPSVIGGKLIDVPWTQVDDVTGSDCAGFVVWCYKLPRWRLGYNRGNPCGVDMYDVEDDLNSNSMIADAMGDQDLFRLVAAPEVGDLVAYPTIRLVGYPLPWIGHVAIVTGVDRAGAWSTSSPQFHLVDIAQCCGGSGRTPAVIATDGSVFDSHTQRWSKWPSVLLRAVP